MFGGDAGICENIFDFGVNVQNHVGLAFASIGYYDGPAFAAVYSSNTVNDGNWTILQRHGLAPRAYPLHLHNSRYTLTAKT